MKYKVEKLQEAFYGKNVTAEQLIDWEGGSCEFYHIFKDNCLHVAQSDDEIDGADVTMYYLVLSGTVEFCLPNERIEVTGPGSMHITFGKDACSFDAFGKTEAQIVHINTSRNSIIDTTTNQLLEQVRQEESRDYFTKRHNFRVGKYADMIMQLVNPSYNSNDLTFAGDMHDIGKLYIDENILNKPGKLTPEEFEEIKKHTVYSYEILKPKLGEKIARIARSHHEKMDGTGYPDGLKGTEILLESRVLAVADIFDALTSQRSYRSRAFTFEEALDILRKDTEAGKLDAACFQALEKLVKEGTIREGEDNLI